MGENSNIEWTDHTWNPVRGCAEVSPGCDHCYARELAKRNPKTLGVWGSVAEGGVRVIAAEGQWHNPVTWNACAGTFMECSLCGWRGDARRSSGCCPECNAVGQEMDVVRQRVFCASLADWLDPDWPIEVLARLLKLIHETPNLDWLLLTKRPENWRARLNEAYVLDKSFDLTACWLAGCAPANVWVGTTAEDQPRADERMPHLLRIPSRVRFLSCEPMLGSINFEEALDPMMAVTADFRFHGLDGIHWVICGGESGPKARPMHPDWARSLRDQCTASGVPFFFKQWGGTNKKAAGRELDGRTWDEVPVVRALHQ